MAGRAKVFLKALAEQAKVSVVTQQSNTITNLSPVAMQVTEQEDYVAQVTTQATANVGTATSIQPRCYRGFLSAFSCVFRSIYSIWMRPVGALPRCFTLAFGMTGAVLRFILFPNSVLPALLAALSVFRVLLSMRTLAYRRDDRAQFGFGDVYLMAGLGMWFSFLAVLWIISGATVSGGLFLPARRLLHPMQW